MERHEDRERAHRCAVPIRIQQGKDFRYRDPEWFKGVEHKENKVIAGICGVSPGTIARWRRAHHSAMFLPKKPRHCPSTPEMKELLDGLLLGAGHLSFGTGEKSAFYQVSFETKGYLEWVDRCLEEVGIDRVSIRKDPNNSKEWMLRTAAYYELLPIRDRWYDRGARDVPADLSLTSKIALHWFVRGGHLEISSGKVRKAVRLWVYRYSHAGRELLLRELQKIGIENPKIYNLRMAAVIRIPTAQSCKLLDYIGDCPLEDEDMAEKWEVIRRS